MHGEPDGCMDAAIAAINRLGAEIAQQEDGHPALTVCRHEIARMLTTLENMRHITRDVFTGDRRRYS